MNLRERANGMNGLKKLMVLMLVGGALVIMCCCGSTAIEEEDIIEEETAGPMTLTEFVNSKEQLVAYREEVYSSADDSLAKDDLVKEIAVFSNDGTVILYNQDAANNAGISTFGDIARMDDDQVADTLAKTTTDETQVLKGEWRADLETDETGNEVEYEVLFIPDPEKEHAIPVIGLDADYSESPVWSRVYDSTFMTLMVEDYGIIASILESWHVRDDNEELELCVDSDLSDSSFYVDKFPNGTISLPE